MRRILTSGAPMAEATRSPARQRAEVRSADTFCEIHGQRKMDNGYEGQGGGEHSKGRRVGIRWVRGYENSSARLRREVPSKRAGLPAPLRLGGGGGGSGAHARARCAARAQARRRRHPDVRRHRPEVPRNEPGGGGGVRGDVHADSRGHAQRVLRADRHGEGRERAMRSTTSAARRFNRRGTEALTAQKRKKVMGK